MLPTRRRVRDTVRNRCEARVEASANRDDTRRIAMNLALIARACACGKREASEVDRCPDDCGQAPEPARRHRPQSSPAVVADTARRFAPVRSGLLDTRARIERRTGFDARAADCEPRFAQSWRRRRPIRPSPIAPNARQAARIPSPERLTCIKPAITDGPHPLDKRNSARRLGAHVFAVRTEKSPCETLFIDGRAP